MIQQACKGRLSNMLQNTQQLCLCRCWFILYSTCWLPYARELCKTIYKTHTASVRDGHFFSNRVINVWNSLPDTVVSSETVTGFKLLDWCSHCNSLVQSGGGIYQSRSPALVSRSTHFSSYCVCIHIAGCIYRLFMFALFVLSNKFDLIWLSCWLSEPESEQKLTFHLHDGHFKDDSFQAVYF